MTDEFLQKYKELEQIIQGKICVREGESAVWALGSVPEFVALRPHLNAIREIRNFLTHQPNFADQTLITPTEAAVKIVENLIAKLQGPNTVYGVCLKPCEILCAKSDDQISPVVSLMQEKQCNFVPIVEQGMVIGVFLNSAELSKDISDETTFYQLKHNTDLDVHIGKTVLFVAKNTSVESAKIQVSECFKQGNRISAIFVTETGKPTESLVGLLLPLQLI
jgi:predicted transcriptional regulator